MVNIAHHRSIHHPIILTASWQLPNYIEIVQYVHVRREKIHSNSEYGQRNSFENLQRTSTAGQRLPALHDNKHTEPANVDYSARRHFGFSDPHFGGLRFSAILSHFEPCYSDHDDGSRRVGCLSKSLTCFRVVGGHHRRVEATPSGVNSRVNRRLYSAIAAIT